MCVKNHMFLLRNRYCQGRGLWRFEICLLQAYSKEIDVLLRCLWLR